MVQSREERIRQKIEQKIGDLSRRMAEFETNEEYQASIREVAEEIGQVESELAELLNSGQEPEPGMRERLEARRDRLIAKQERLELRVELRRDTRERLQESLDEMQLRLQETIARAQEASRERVGRGFDWHQSRGPQPSPSPASGDRRMQEERRKILEMVQQGTITAEDAAQLLDALRDQEETARRHRRPRWVRIRVTDVNADKVRVNLTLPVGLVRAGLRAGGSIAGVEGLDTAGLEEMLDRGEIGHILDVQDDAGGERVEIFVE